MELLLLSHEQITCKYRGSMDQRPVTHWGGEDSSQSQCLEMS